MVNPHWDETINEDEDIGFRGPHSDFNERITDTRTPSLAWSPQGEFGQHGEFSGWKGQEDPASYTSDWQDYPSDEFTGIQSNVPSRGGFLRNIFEKYGGNLGRLGGGLETPYHHRQWQQDQDLLRKRKYDKYLEFQNQNRNRFNPDPGPWNEFNPRSRYGTVGEADWGEDLMALNIGDTFPLEGLGRKRPYGGTLDLGPQYEELETIPLDLQFDQWGNPIGNDDYGYFNDTFAARGGLI